MVPRGVCQGCASRIVKRTLPVRYTRHGRVCCAAVLGIFRLLRGAPCPRGRGHGAVRPWGGDDSAGAGAPGLPRNFSIPALGGCVITLVVRVITLVVRVIALVDLLLQRRCASRGRGPCTKRPHVSRIGEVDAKEVRTIDDHGLAMQACHAAVRCWRDSQHRSNRYPASRKASSTCAS